MSVAVMALGPVMPRQHAASPDAPRWSHRLAREVVLAARRLAPVILRSPLPDVAIPDVTLAAFVLQRAAELGEKPALIDGPSGRTLTYGALASGVERLAGGLAARGHRRGDVIGLFAPNIPEYALVFLAIARLGGVITTFNSLATSDDLAQQLRDSGARAIVTVPPFLDRAAPAAAAAGLEATYVIGQADGATSIADLMTDAGAPPDGPASPDDLVVLPYSSGTTGLPKGVMLTHRNLVTNTIQVGVQQDVREDERMIGILPFFHIYGMTVVMNLALSRGATIVTMPRFELDGFLGLMELHRITRAMLVPPIIIALAKHPAVEGRDLSALELIMSGAAPLDAGIEVAAAERLGCLVVQGYGMTEASPVTHATSDVAGTAKPGSIGPLLPNTEARIVDVTSGEDLPAGQDGELLDPRPAGHARLPEQPRGDRADHRRRWLAPFRRRGTRRRGRLLHDRRPAQGAHQVQGLPGGAGRARGGAHRPSGGDRRRRHPDPGRRGRRGAEGVRRAGRAGRRRTSCSPTSRRASHRTSGSGRSR